MILSYYWKWGKNYQERTSFSVDNEIHQSLKNFDAFSFHLIQKELLSVSQPNSLNQFFPRIWILEKKMGALKQKGNCASEKENLETKTKDRHSKWGRCRY